MAGIGGNNIGNGIVDRRRRLVATLMIQRPGITRRQLHEVIAKQMVNPVTETPYSLATIQNDCAALKQRWRDEAFQDTAILVGMEWSKLDEAEKTAWQINDLTKRITMILKISERRAKLKGYDAPTKIAPTDPTGTKEYGMTDDERIARIAEIIDRARTRGDTESAVS